MGSTVAAMLIQQCNAQPNGPSAAALFSKAANDSLIRQGTAPRIAAAWSSVYASSFTYVQTNPTLQNAATLYRLQHAFVGLGYANDSVSIFYSAKAVDSALGIAGLSGLIDLMVAVANANGVTLNGCAVSIAKVSSDLAGMAIGGATAMSGVGTVLFVMGAAGAVIDVGGLASACGPS